MPDFNFKAARMDGAVEQGRLTAASEQAALRQLRTQGLTPVRIQVATGSAAVVESATEAAPARKPGFSLFSREGSVGQDDVYSMTSELAVLLRAGLPIDRALKVQADMSVKEGYTQLLQHLLDTLKGGKPLSTALETRNDIFGNFYINMVRSGEASGRLAEVLGELAEYLDRSREVRSSVVSALIYPGILALVAVISIIVMLGFVVPQFQTLFEDMGEALPALTRGVIAAGNTVGSYWWLLAIIIGGLFYGIRNWVATPQGRLWTDTKVIALPVAGEILFKYEIGRFSRTMGTLLGNGVSMLPSINIALNTVENTVVRTSLESLAPAVKGGRRMSEVLLESGTFTPMMIQMVRVGEESGRLDEMMIELARIYDGEVQAGIKRGLTLLEPLLILGMGGAIALIIVSILMGILSVNDLAM